DRPPGARLSCAHGRHRPPLPACRPGRAHRGAGGTLRTARRREPQPAPAAGATGRRTLAAAGQERAGALPGRGHDPAAQVAGAAHVSAANEPVNVRLLDREYTVGVEPEERDSLIAAARLLDAR